MTDEKNNSYIVSVLEEGKRLYDVGTKRQMCLLLDRGGEIWKNGKKKVDKRDLGVIPALVDLFRHLYGTIMVSKSRFII